MSPELALPAAPYVVHTISIPDQPNLLSLVAADGGYVWVRGLIDDQEGIVAWGLIDSVSIDGPERFSRAQRWWNNWVNHVTGDGPIAFASFAFMSRPGTSTMCVPQFVVQRNHGETTLTVIGVKNEIDQLVTQARHKLSQPDSQPTLSGEVQWLDGSRPVAEWEAQVERAVERITNGELDKVVLARDIVAHSAEPIHIGALLTKLNHAYPECWTFCVDGLVGATPELLIRREGEQITSRVLAGTVRRSSDDARDGELAAALISSDKDQEEHAYAVSSVAAALANHCTDLFVPESPSVLRLANVQHLATDITGNLADNATALVLAASLHPTAAVCGTPTERAFSVIQELEGMERGRYSGPVGWVDSFGDGEFGIALRCGQFEDDEQQTIRLFAGCGLVAGSTGEAEVAESQAKFNAMRNALSN